MSERIENITKSKLLIAIRAERKALEEVLAALTYDQMLQPGASGEWTVKDALAHISAWERRMLSWIGSHLRGEAPDVPLPWDVERMNAETYAQVKDRPLAEVLEEFRRSYREALTLAESLSEEQLQTAYTDTWPMGPLWLGVAANTDWHYKEHRKDIEAWLKQQKAT
ncbi:MAG: ClbS/DfsB family four-helix bundle protein [Anaerolineales bacterium]|nr:ClbS/DfsB family four-helix bundle protein [Anaerolineales bacterium]